MHTKNIIQIVLVLIFFTYNPANAQSRKKAKREDVKVESVIKDANGKPVSNATIYGKEGSVKAKSDINGNFTITIPAASNLLIESDEHESLVINQQDVKSSISLQLTPYMKGIKDDVKIAFGTKKRADLLGATTVINPTDFISFDNARSVSDAINGRVAGMIGSTNIRGFGNAIVVLDGIPRYSNIAAVDLSLEEIEQITVLKDAGAVALYGTQARNGVIIITTKRGKALKRDINVTAQYGIASPKALPNYLGSADYMELYNEARVNDGLPQQFDATTIENYRNGNKYRFPSTDYYSPELLKSHKTYSKYLAEFSGGNENTTFYANLGLAQDNSLLNFGPWQNAKNNRINARANVDFKINDFIKSNVDIAGIINFNESPKGNYYNNGAIVKPFMYSPLLPLNLIDPNNAGLQDILNARKNDIDGLYLLGGNQQYQSTPFGDAYAGGRNEEVSRTMQFNNSIDFDLSQITKGLSFKTNISFDFYNYYVQSIGNTYSIYEPKWSATADSIAGLVQYGTDTRPGTQNISNQDFSRRIGFFGQLNYNRTFGLHQIDGTLLGYANTVKINGTYQPDKATHLGLRIDYNYRDKYYVDFSSALVSSNQLPKEKRVSPSPVVSLGWVINREQFMADIDEIDYLKLKTSAGIINSDMSLGGFYYYESIYAEQSGFTWSDGAWSNAGIMSQRGANTALGFEKRKEFNIGFEGQFFNKSVIMDVNLFNTDITDKYTRNAIKYPTYYTDFTPWENYGVDRYKGVELAINYTKKIGGVEFDLGTNMLYKGSTVILKDEIYAEEYLYRTGKPVDSYFGLESLGLFSDQNEIDNHAFQTFGVVRPGDIKYKDQNEDGLINNNDQVKIGRSQSPFYYGINLKVSYKNFSVFAMGTGSHGSNAYITGSNDLVSAYFRPSGDDKYSVKAMERWTEATKTTAKYPRLSTLSNTNNKQASSFWLYDNNYFNINRVQLTYDLGEKVCESLGMKSLSFYLNGSGLVTFSKQNDVRNLNIGGEPNYRYFTLGLRSMF
ncbi:MAG TPA: SusC/RagA family TonB-linked outer membrane protein [Marinilabiliales bacterium]|nr:SusC/RagA family TonB-linked outer membrane protein [Marinilabiliales bacterium]